MFYRFSENCSPERILHQISNLTSLCFSPSESSLYRLFPLQKDLLDVMRPCRFPCYSLRYSRVSFLDGSGLTVPAHVFQQRSRFSFPLEAEHYPAGHLDASACWGSYMALAGNKHP